jgi:homopolymeric O-antigen transport system permease protein
MSVTADPTIVARASAPAPAAAKIRIEPPRTWLQLRLREVWMYRELLHFFCVAGPEAAVQANSRGRSVGGAATAAEHGRFHFIFWQAGKTAVGRTAVSGVLFCGAGSLDVFFRLADENYQYRGGKPKFNYQSVLSAWLILPISGVVSGLVDFGISFAVLLGMVLAYGLRPGVNAIWLCCCWPWPRRWGSDCGCRP